MITRGQAAGRVVLLYLLIQAMSYLVLQQACSAYALRETWTYGALGPLAAVEAVPRFRYHSWLANAAFIGWSVLVLVAPLAFIVRPTRTMLVVTAVALAVWCLFGLGFSVTHM